MCSALPEASLLWGTFKNCVDSVSIAPWVPQVLGNKPSPLLLLSEGKGSGPEESPLELSFYFICLLS